MESIMFLVEIPMEYDPQTVTMAEIFDKIRDYYVSEAARLSTATGDERWPSGTLSLSGDPVFCAVENTNRGEPNES